NSNGSKPIVFKLTETGALDTTFNGTGVFFPENGVPGFGTGGGAEAYGAVPQGTKLVTTGYGKEQSSQPANGWISLRLNADGTFASTYGTNGHVFLGINDQGANSRAITVLSDKRVVLLGGGSPPKPSPDAGTQSQYAGIAILTENGQLDTTFSTGG